MRVVWDFGPVLRSFLGRFSGLGPKCHFAFRVMDESVHEVFDVVFDVLVFWQHVVFGHFGRFSVFSGFWLVRANVQKGGLVRNRRFLGPF